MLNENSPETAQESSSTSFPATRQDISKLKDTAKQAAQDLRSTAAEHAEKTRGQLSDLATHAQQEGAQQVEQMKGQMSDLADAFREYASARPLATLGIAFAVGFLFGRSRRSRR